MNRLKLTLLSICCAPSNALAAIAQSILRLAKGWTVRLSNPDGGEIFPTHPDRP